MKACCILGHGVVRMQIATIRYIMMTSYARDVGGEGG